MHLKFQLKQAIIFIIMYSSVVGLGNGLIMSLIIVPSFHSVKASRFPNCNCCRVGTLLV